MPGYILLIDDDPKHLGIYWKGLTHEGYEVHRATNGIEGLQSIRNRVPDLVILDLSMPGIHGLELCELIRKDSRTATIPILMFSVISGSDYESQSLQKGADLYLAKSTDRSVFLQHVRRLVARGRSDLPVQCVLSVEISDVVRHNLSGCLVDSDVGGPFTQDRARLNSELVFMGEVVYAHHESFLEALRRGEPIADDLERRAMWRLQAKQKGEDLYRAIFDHNSTLMEAWGKAQARVLPLDERLILRFRGPRENLALPLELMPSRHVPLAIRHPLSRQVTGVSLSKPGWQRFVLANRGKTVRTLVIAGNQSALSEATIIHEKLQAALAKIGVSVELEPTELTQAFTASEAVQRLEKRNYHIIHFAGHASFDRKRPENSYLSLAEGTRIRSSELHNLLTGSPTQFLFLSCCSGAEISDMALLRENSFLGLLDAAVQAGVPAAIGYRWPVVNRSARAFASHFYDGLIQYPHSLEYAAWWARKNIFEANGWDETWFSPMLIEQSPD